MDKRELRTILASMHLSTIDSDLEDVWATFA